MGPLNMERFKPSDECPQIERLSLLAEGELDDATSADVRRHAEACAECSTVLGELESNAQLVDRVRRALGRGPHATGRGFSPPGFADVKEIGRGGMGVVYRAHQIEPPREVALKVIRGAHAFDDHALRLFRREIRALARLQHPNIAGLYDAGRTPDGESFLVMELVRGKPLHDYLRGRGLSIEARLLLFVRIGRAVAAAHQRGVIHRDLKPGNVLVDEQGEPKVLDFGLAKIESSDEDPPSMATEVGSVRGTLPYMSPEQSSGDPSRIDSRSDVYSLGVVLYELLTGQLPIEVAHVPLHEAARRIEQVAPVPPGKHDPRLRGDLETIVQKSLAKDPDARYQSAAALCDDVERYLSKEMIQARPPSGAYLLRKLIQRHRLITVLVCSLFVTSVGASIWLAHLYSQAQALRRDADHERDEARGARDRALQSQQRARVEARTKSRVSEVLVHMIQRAAADRGGDEVRVADVLPRAEAAMRAETETDPEVAAVLAMVLAEIRVASGQYEESEALFRVALEYEPTDERVDWDAVRLRGMLARLLMERGRLDEAETLLADAEQLVPRIVEPSAVFALELRERRAALWNKRGQYPRAEAALRAILEEYEALDSATPDGLAGLCDGLSVALARQGKRDESIAYARRSVELYTGVYGEHHTRTLVARMNVASNLLDSGDAATARDMLQDIVDAHTAELGPDHHYTLWARHNLGNAWTRLDDDARALEILEPTLERERATLGDKSATTIATLDLVAACLYRQKRFKEAEQSARALYTAVEGVYDAPHDLWLRARFSLGRVLYTNKQYEECERVLLEGWAALEKNGLDTHSMRPAFAKFLTTLYDRTSRKELADLYRGAAK